jgi:2-polyprenyl-3-methyl-5-hydroxy-6-metoxy-1,4-benzoquinol methylase
MRRLLSTYLRPSSYWSFLERQLAARRSERRLRENRAIRQRTLDERNLGPVRLVRIEQTARAEAYVGDEDRGYHNFGNGWWFNRDCPFAFKYLDIDGLYPEPYFEAAGHLTRDQALELVRYMLTTYRSVMGRSPETVLDLGPGSGQIAKALTEEGIAVTLVEGTSAGTARLRADGFAEGRVKQANIKFLSGSLGKFDLVWCTELAEHIEPFFASKIVEVCCSHAPAVWFSAADPYRPAHYHHMNEQPIEVWDNLFAHFAFDSFVELENKHGRSARLYLRADVARALARARETR